MQRLRRILRPRLPRWLDDFHYGQETARSTQRLFGFIGIGALTVALAVSAVIYFVPMGTQRYTAMLTDAGTIRAGEDVRLAGISVGTVEKVELTDQAVRMEFTVENDVMIGDNTSLDIRMLTPVGGHYLAVIPSGTRPLGSEVIPADRVSLPYNLVEALQDAQRPLSGIETDNVRQNLSLLTQSFAQAPRTLDAASSAADSIVSIIDQQNESVGRALEVAEDYLKLLADNRASIGSMLTKIGEMEDTVLTRRGEVIESLRVIRELLGRLVALEPLWTENLEPLADKLLKSEPQLLYLGDRLKEVAALLGEAGDRLRALIDTTDGITVDGSDQVISVRPCIPTVGKEC